MVSNSELSLVSIVVPCYNCSETIIDTLKSLEKQSYPLIEVILVNDGSIDNTEMIIKNYIENSKLKVKYYKKENEGVSIARNFGITQACGKYILFLDSDDVYHFDFVRCLVESVEIKNLDTAYCYWTRDIDSLLNNSEIVKISDSKVLSQKELMCEFLYNKGKIGFWAFIYKTEIIRNHSIAFTPYRKTFEDVEFTWKYLTHCNSGLLINKKLYGYRNTRNSAVKKVYWERTDALKSVLAIEKYLKEHECDFYPQFKEYMYSRMIWSYAKTFAKGGRKDLYNRLISEYDVKYHMKKMIRIASSRLVRVSSIVYCIHPSLFYFLIRLYPGKN